MTNQENGFVGFEYLEVPAKRTMESLYVDSYRSFGWAYEGTFAQEGNGGVRIKFKRDRRIRNKAELTRLQRQFEACAREIEALERSKTSAASIAAVTIGPGGGGVLGGSRGGHFDGKVALMVVLGVPGFLGWIAPYFCYRKMRLRRDAQVAPIIEEKNDEIYTVCQQGFRLLTA